MWKEVFIIRRNFLHETDLVCLYQALRRDGPCLTWSHFNCTQVYCYSIMTYILNQKSILLNDNLLLSIDYLRIQNSLSLQTLNIPNSTSSSKWSAYIYAHKHLHSEQAMRIMSQSDSQLQITYSIKDWNG